MSGRGGPGWGGEWKLRNWASPKTPVHDAAGLERLERAVDEANAAIDAIEKRLRLGRPKDLGSIPSIWEARDHLAVVVDDLERGRAAAEIERLQKEAERADTEAESRAQDYSDSGCVKSLTDRDVAEMMTAQERADAVRASLVQAKAAAKTKTEEGTR